VIEFDPESGAVIPDSATAPFPNPCESAHDYATEARDHVVAQYRDSPRLMGTVDDLVANTQAMEGQLVAIPGLDDPAIAGGVNLDVTGDLVGQSRVLKTGTELSDANYRLLIAQRILRNKSIGSGPEFVDALTAVLSPTTFRFVDLGHMAVIVEIATGGPPTDDQIALLDYGPTPRAMAVGVGRRWYDPASYFGFIEDPSALGFAEIGDPPPPGGHLAEIF
jgi:hypothetical protein